MKILTRFFHWNWTLWYSKRILSHCGKGGTTNSREFLEKFQRGEGSFSIQKFILQILGTLNRAVWLWNWYKIIISGLRVCIFKLSYCITIVSRLDICPSVTVMTGGLVKFCKFHPRKQFISMQNLCRNMIFTHLCHLCLTDSQKTENRAI